MPLFLKVPWCLFCAKLRLWEIICLQMVPLFLFLSCDWSETKLQRREENADGRIILSVHENGKREKHEYDKENRKFARSEKHGAAFHMNARAPWCRARGDRKRGALVFMLSFNAHESCLPCIRLLYVSNLLKVLYVTEAHLSVCELSSQQVSSTGYRKSTCLNVTKTAKMRQR